MTIDLFVEQLLLPLEQESIYNSTKVFRNHHPLADYLFGELFNGTKQQDTSNRA